MQYPVQLLYIFSLVTRVTNFCHASHVAFNKFSIFLKLFILYFLQYNIVLLLYRDATPFIFWQSRESHFWNSYKNMIPTQFVFLFYFLLQGSPLSLYKLSYMRAMCYILEYRSFKSWKTSEIVTRVTMEWLMCVITCVCAW